MSEHRASIEWSLAGEFRYETYSRHHVLDFGNGVRVAGSAAPGNVPATAKGPPGVDPEQAFVAALASCHMLWFLHLACRAGYVVQRYADDAVGVLDRTWMSTVTLRPVVTFGGRAPDAAAHARLHEQAHEKCFIANSVKSDVRVEPRIA